MNKVRWLEETCNNCGCQINSWDKRISKTLAYRYPNCERCIAEEYDMNVEDLRERMERFFGMRPCMCKFQSIGASIPELAVHLF